MKTIKFFILSIVILTSCKVSNYSIEVIDPDPNLVYVNRIPTTQIKKYDIALYNSWNLTYSRNIQIKYNIDKEIDQRLKNKTKVRKWLSGIGGISGFGTAVYVLAAVNPSTTVIGILGLFSGTTLITSFNFAENDERLITLIEKSKKLEILKANAEKELTNLEQLFGKKYLATVEGKIDMSKKVKVTVDPVIVDIYYKIEDQIVVFRTAISNWENEAK